MAEVKCIQVFYQYEDPDNGVTRGLHRIPIYPQCPYFNAKGCDNDTCTHPKSYWGRCSTGHMLPMDNHSCPFNIHEELRGEMK